MAHYRRPVLSNTNRDSIVIDTPPTHHRPARHHHQLRGPIILTSVVVALLIIDAFVRRPGDLDYRLIDATQRIEAEWLEPVARTAESSLTQGAAWIVLVVLFAAVLRRWLPAVIAGIMPLAALASWVLGEIIEQSGPDPGRLVHSPFPAGESTFPAGSVLAVTLILGYPFFLVRDIERAPLRAGARLLFIGAIALAGFAVLWSGRYWPADILGGYAFGIAALLVLVWLHRRIESAVGDIPFIHAARVPHDASLPHAQALTSTILFREGRAIKIYAPGFVPRAIYWLAFQAEFPYMRNRAALEAAVRRRNLAGRLTEYWYGSNRVARALGIVETEGHLGIASEYIEPAGDPDPAELEAFLYDLSERFDEAGLPTWQIDPRQPRGKDNVLQGTDGRFHIIDLESGLVSPIASPHAWWRAFQRGDVPLFDAVFFDITRDYVECEAEAMRAKLGDAWLVETLYMLDRAEASADAWHATEPRIWSHMLQGVLHGFSVGRIPGRTRVFLGRSLERAERWIFAAIEDWEADGRLTPDEAAHIRDEVIAPRVHRVLPHFGVHLTIGLFTRFPVGSILRASYTLLNFLSAVALLFLRRIDLSEWRERMSIHSPLVILIAGSPGIGTFAYLASGPIRSNQLLVRILLDTVLVKLPYRLYERLGWRSIIARPSRQERDAIRNVPGRLSFLSFRFRPYSLAITLGMAGAALILTGLVLNIFDATFSPSTAWWASLLELFDADRNDSLIGWFAGAVLVAAIAALLLIAIIWRNGHSLRLPLTGLALIFLLPMFDEHMPESVEVVSVFQEAIGGGFDDPGDWIATALAAVLVVLLVSTAVWFLRDLPEYLRGLFVVAVALYFGGALGVEILVYIYEFLADGPGTIRRLLISIERLLELGGIVLAFFGVLEYARWLPAQRLAVIASDRP